MSKSKVKKQVSDSARMNGLLAARKRWGCDHGKTVTIRAFGEIVNLLRLDVPMVERAQFVTDALTEALRKRLEAKGRDFDLLLGAAQL